MINHDQSLNSLFIVRKNHALGDLRLQLRQLSADSVPDEGGYNML